MAHYLDYNATAPLRPEVMEIMRELLAQPLNASSVHAPGRKARSVLEDARRTIAETISAFPTEVIFTASGTEANNWVLHGIGPMPLFISAIEHSSVLRTAKAFPRTALIPATTEGLVDLEEMAKLLPREGPFLLSLMLANNETGILQPVAEAAKLVHSRGGLFHCDAVQAFGKIPVDFTALGCDFMTISAHKMGGPVGAAALVVKNRLELAPLITGGGQELGRRAGTEPVAVIAGFARAAELIDLARLNALRGWLDEMEDALSEAGAVIIGRESSRLPNTSLIAFSSLPSETQLIRFDLAGIAVSAGSACSSGRVEPSYVLRAMGMVEDIAGSAVRISGGWNTSKENITAVANLFAHQARFK